MLRLSFFVFVILPTLVSATYLTFFASKEYVSEARFAVRRGSETKMPAVLEGLSFLSSMSGTNRSTTQDAFIVTDYIRSRTIIEDQGGKEVLHDIYSRPDADWWSRLPTALPLEKVWKYWKNKVSAIIDTPSGIITLETIAYTPGDAHRLAERIIQSSERLVNEITERSRHDAIVRAESEVALAQERLRNARQALLAFRNQSNSIDPVASAVSLGTTITALTREKSKLENDRAGMVGVTSAESPVKRQLDARIGNLETQISELQEQLTNQKQDTAISSQLAKYEDLQLESQFGEKLYAIAQTAYEQARAEQEKKQLYLVTIVKPTMPEEAYYPRIWVGSAVIFAVCFVFWSMAALVFASIRDHMGG